MKRPFSVWFKRVVQNHDGPILHFPVLHHISANASIRSVSKLSLQAGEMPLPPCTVHHSPTLEKLGSCHTHTHIFFSCSVFSDEWFVVKWINSIVVIIEWERPGNLGCKGLRLHSISVCFYAEGNKTDEEGEKGGAEKENRAEPDSLLCSTNRRLRPSDISGFFSPDMSAL